jgi:hypothetical protein
MKKENSIHFGHKTLLYLYRFISVVGVLAVWGLGYETIMFFFSLVPVGEWAGLIKLGVGIVTIPSAIGLCILFSTVVWTFFSSLRPRFLDDVEEAITQQNWKARLRKSQNIK